MKRICILIILLISLSVPVHAAQIEAPKAPADVADLLPSENATFQEGLQYVICLALRNLAPDLRNSIHVCASILACVIVLSLLKSYEGKCKTVLDLAGVVSICCLLLGPTNTLVQLGAETVTAISEYGKVFIPVMTAALAAQGGSGTAGALFASTVFFNTVLSSAVSHLLVPGIYIYLSIAIVNVVVNDDAMKKLSDFIKWVLSWGLKLVLYAFTGYVSITGVVNGTADQTAIKAAKVALGGFVPVVGGIMSDASETILVGASLVKNSVGVYGLITLLALVIGPFLKIGSQYLLMKLTTALCGGFTDKGILCLLESFTAAMGLLLAMTGCVCLLLMISVICFLRGIG